MCHLHQAGGEPGDPNGGQGTLATPVEHVTEVPTVTVANTLGMVKYSYGKCGK